MSLHGELTGAAARRRGRRLRSWLRHERQTVAMVLAEACHHSSGTFPPTLKERRMAGQDAYEALRGQKTARTAGLHPDELVEPGVQGRAVTVGYVAARVPTLAGHRLASDDDGVDGRTVRFLLKQSLAEKKKEWEEERRRMVQESVEQVRARVDAENAARHAASSSTGKRRKRKKRRKKRLPRTPRLRQGRRRPCDHQRHVLAVRGAPVPVHRQSGGHSCSMSMDLADPVSSGKYCGAFVFTATVAEPTVMSFTVPLNGYSIVATATVVTSCFCGLFVLLECLRRDVVWWWFFTPGGAYDSVWYSVRPMTGNYFLKYFQYQEVVGCSCMLNYWFSSYDEICPDNFNYSRFKLKGKCRSEKWEVYLDRAHDQYQEDVGCVCMLNDWISCYDGICTDNHNRQHGRYGPEEQHFRRGDGSGLCKAGFAGFAPRAVFLLSLSCPDALQHGRYGPD